MATNEGSSTTVLKIVVDGKHNYIEVDNCLLQELNSNDPVVKQGAFKKIQSKLSGSTCTEMEVTQPSQDDTESISSDIEDNSTKRSTSPWPTEATTFLISLYQTHEEAMENTTNKKKNVWADITKEMNNAGHHYSQNQVESKWRSLLKSHKLVRENCSQTGAKRKSFQHFDQIDEIVSKRHDINPPHVDGSIKISQTKKFMSKHTSDENSDSSCGKFEKVKKPKLKTTKSESVASETLQFLKSAEDRRRVENEERERNKDRRANERNDILKSFLDVFKKSMDE